jgi:hypothetical protein
MQPIFGVIISYLYTWYYFSLVFFSFGSRALVYVWVYTVFYDPDISLSFHLYQNTKKKELTPVRRHRHLYTYVHVYTHMHTYTHTYIHFNILIFVYKKAIKNPLECLSGYALPSRWRAPMFRPPPLQLLCNTIFIMLYRRKYTHTRTVLHLIAR